MTSWSRRRKFVYGLMFSIVVVVLIIIPSYLTFYKAPTCFDGKKNGDEQGTDCGGSCRRLCANAFLTLPSASWVRFKEVSSGSYSVAAYVVNPNRKAGSENIPYTITFVDKDGFDLEQITGTFDVYAGRSTLIFRTGIKIDGTIDKVPARAFIEYPLTPEWRLAADPLAEITVDDNEYRNDEEGSLLEITISNHGTKPVRNLTVCAVLKNADGNVIDFSKTVIDEIPAGGSGLAPFTWPVRPEESVVSIETVLMPE